eukprot:6034348-Amphidinium_carterae.1
MRQGSTSWDPCHTQAYDASKRSACDDGAAKVNRHQVQAVFIRVKVLGFSINSISGRKGIAGVTV